MDWKSTSKKAIGVIGAGNFGTSIANMLAKKNAVLMYARDVDQVAKMLETSFNKGRKLHQNITPTNDLSLLASSCNVIFPIVSSKGFRPVIQQLAEYLHPYHILIHGTKGLDISIPKDKTLSSYKKLSRKEVKTMSEVIRDETVVVRIGCLAGPNLAKELADDQPAATVVASPFDEVISIGQKLLKNHNFQVYGNKHLIGIELAGVLKNIIAIASGALSGLGLGENAKGLLISRGIVEMIYLGKSLGGNTEAFLGLAGIGDLVTTCNSTLSRNYTVGYRMAKGESLDQIIGSMDEVAEGVNTVQIVKLLINDNKVKAPITEMIYKLLFERVTAEQVLQYLMKYPFNVDIGFL